MRRRAWIAAGAVSIAFLAACGGDQSTNSGGSTPPSPAALALHFDTLAGALKASNPGDIRLVWYQDIASILARGISPSGLSVDAQGFPAVFEALTEVDAFPDSVGGKLLADSTYRLAAWAPSTKPTEFIDLRVQFLPAGAGKPDTLTRILTLYTDTAGGALIDQTFGIGVNVLSARGTCQITPLQNLTVPTNPCTRVAVDWLVEGGSGLLYINPAAQVSGTHLTH